MTEFPNIEPLVRAASRGDRKSEEKLFALLYKFVTASIKKRWRSSFSEDEINDVLFDSLEKLLATFRDPEKAERVIEQGRVFGFVHVVAENTALDYNRKRVRKSKVFVSIDEHSGNDETNANWESRLQPLDSGADLSDMILGGMESVRILSQLEEKYRKIIAERVSGLEYEEIAENNGITVANARQIHKRGIGMLRQNMIIKHKSVLSSLPASQSAVLRRLYLKEEVELDSTPCTEDEALEGFYMALVSRGLFLILFSITVGITQ